MTIMNMMMMRRKTIKLIKRKKKSFDDVRKDDGRGYSRPCPKYHNTEVELAPC